MHYPFDYKVRFTIPGATIANSNPIINYWHGWSHSIDIEFMSAEEIIQELSAKMHECGALQQVQHDDDTDDYHDFELDEDMVDDLFTVTGDSDWEELGCDVDAGLDDLLGDRDDIVRVLAGDDDEEEIIGIWKSLARLLGSEYVDRDFLRDNYVGRYDSMTDFAIEHIESLGEFPNIVKYNLNWAGVVKDLESHYHYDPDSGHLFNA